MNNNSKNIQTIIKEIKEYQELEAQLKAQVEELKAQASIFATMARSPIVRYYQSALQVLSLRSSTKTCTKLFRQ